MIAFEPSQDLSAAVQRARGDVQAWCTVRGTAPREKWAEWGGEHLARMMREREFTAHCLDDASPRIRLAAAALVADYWVLNERFTATMLRLAFTDPEPSIRGAALVSLVVLKQYVIDPSGWLHEVLAQIFPAPPAKVDADVILNTQTSESSARELLMQRWDNLAGPHATHMLESRTIALSYLVHANSQLRRCAIHVLRVHWGPDLEFTHICETLAFQDTDIEVRLSALSALACCFADTDDQRIGEVVAKVVYDEFQPYRFRSDAYKSLFTIRGMPVAHIVKVNSASFRFPEDVDWDFVRSFLPANELTGSG